MRTTCRSQRGGGLVRDDAIVMAQFAVSAGISSQLGRLVIVIGS